MMDIGISTDTAERGGASFRLRHCGSDHVHIDAIS